MNEDATDDAIAYMETEEVKALTERIKAATGALKVPDEMQQATDENPYDATALIINNSFELDNEGATNGGTNGWSYNTKATGDTGARELSNETYAYTSEYGDEVGNYTFNTWHGSAVEGGFYLTQTIASVPAGTYELKALLAADLGTVIGLTANGDGKAYTLETPKDQATEGDIIFKLVEDGNLEIRVSSDSWFKADYFRLTYYGKDSSKEPNVTGADEIIAEPVEIVAIYNAAGAQIPAMQSGLNFVQYSSGKVLKK